MVLQRVSHTRAEACPPPCVKTTNKLQPFRHRPGIKNIKFISPKKRLEFNIPAGKKEGTYCLSRAMYPILVVIVLAALLTPLAVLLIRFNRKRSHILRCVRSATQGQLEGIYSLLERLQPEPSARAQSGLECPLPAVSSRASPVAPLRHGHVRAGDDRPSATGRQPFVGAGRGVPFV